MSQNMYRDDLSSVADVYEYVYSIAASLPVTGVWVPYVVIFFLLFSHLFWVSSI